MIVTTLIGALVLGAPLAQEKSIEVPLRTHNLTKTELGTDYPLFGSTIDIRYNQPEFDPDRYRLPKGFQPTGAGEIVIGSQHITVLASLAEDEKSIKCLWVDWNNNQIAEDTELSNPTGKNKRFTNSIVYAFPSSSGSPVQLLGFSIATVKLVYTTCQTAEAILNGHRIQMRILDTNFDGNYSLNEDKGMDLVDTRIKSKDNKQ